LAQPPEIGERKPEPRVRHGIIRLELQRAAQRFLRRREIPAQALDEPARGVRLREPRIERERALDERRGLGERFLDRHLAVASTAGAQQRVRVRETRVRQRELRVALERLLEEPHGAAQRVRSALVELVAAHEVQVVGRDVARAGHDARRPAARSEEHTSELQSRENLVCRLLLEKKKQLVMSTYSLYP